MCAGSWCSEALRATAMLEPLCVLGWAEAAPKRPLTHEQRESAAPLTGSAAVHAGACIRKSSGVLTCAPCV